MTISFEHSVTVLSSSWKIRCNGFIKIVCMFSHVSSRNENYQYFNHHQMAATNFPKLCRRQGLNPQTTKQWAYYLTHCLVHKWIWWVVRPHLWRTGCSLLLMGNAESMQYLLSALVNSGEVESSIPVWTTEGSQQLAHKTPALSPPAMFKGEIHTNSLLWCLHTELEYRPNYKLWNKTSKSFFCELPSYYVTCRLIWIILPPDWAPPPIRQKDLLSVATTF